MTRMVYFDTKPAPAEVALSLATSLRQQCDEAGDDLVREILLDPSARAIFEGLLEHQKTVGTALLACAKEMASSADPRAAAVEALAHANVAIDRLKTAALAGRGVEACGYRSQIALAAVATMRRLASRRRRLEGSSE